MEETCVIPPDILTVSARPISTFEKQQALKLSKASLIHYAENKVRG